MKDSELTINDCPRCGYPKPSCKCKPGKKDSDQKSVEDNKNPTPTDKGPHPLQTTLQDHLVAAKISGLSIGYCYKGQTKYQSAGVINTLTGHTVETSTLFQAASLSKVVSAVIVLNLAKKNNLNIDTPLMEISDYGPKQLRESPYYNKLTIRMILGQTSGLPNWFTNETEKNFLMEPNVAFNYSGVAFEFLKEVIEKQFRKEWDTLAQEFFHEIEMSSSTFRQLGATHLKDRQLACGHDADGVPDPIKPPLDAPSIPAASLITTAEDYMRFLQYCFKDVFVRSMLFTGSTSLSNVFFETPDAVKKIKWGLGIGIFEHEAKKIAFHWGNNPFSHAFTAIDINTGDAVVCFANSVNGPNLFKKVTEFILDDMSTVFDWLSRYCSFNAVVCPKIELSVKDTLLNLFKTTLKNKDFNTPTLIHRNRQVEPLKPRQESNKELCISDENRARPAKQFFI